jgi:ribosomal protein L7/L12
MSISYTEYERMSALERRVDELEAQVKLLHDLVGQRTGLGASQGERFDVVLTRYPPSEKISVIKAIRELTGLGLREAKDLSESVPCVIRQDLDDEGARTTQRRFAELNAAIELRPR